MNERQGKQRTVLLAGEWKAIPDLRERLHAVGYRVVAVEAGATTAPADLVVVALGAQEDRLDEATYPGGGDLPVVVVAAEESDAVLRQALASGVDGFVLASSTDRLLRTTLELARQRRPRALSAEGEYGAAQMETQQNDDFSAVIGHELRTPLTSLRLYHDLLAAHPERLPEYLKVLRRETGRLIRIAEALLDVARLDKDEATSQLAALPLRPVVEQALQEIKVEEALGSLNTRVEVPADLPAIWGNPESLRWLLRIILHNAAYYTPSGGQITVEAELDRDQGDGRQLTLRVADTGLGLSAEDKRRAFDRFYRGTAARATNLPGAGLGLAIARSLVAQLGGAMTLESPGMGAGTTVMVRLPVVDK